MRKITNVLSTFALLGAFLGLTTSVLAIGSGPVSKYNFSAATGNQAGEVNLSWTDDPVANKYDLVYGYEPGKYLFGAQNIKEYSTPNQPMKFTVKALNPGTNYYFALIPVDQTTPVMTTEPVVAEAKPGVIAIEKPVVAVAPVTAAVPMSRLIAKTGIKPGEVILSWRDDGSAYQYDISYGFEANKYLWGAQDIKETVNNDPMSFTVRGLNSGQAYYFAMIAENGEGTYLFNFGTASAVAR